MDWLLVLVGLGLLLVGGEALVRGASGVALAARLSPAVVGLTGTYHNLLRMWADA